MIPVLCEARAIKLEEGKAIICLTKTTKNKGTGRTISVPFSKI
jgi:hypothetical protein